MATWVDVPCGYATLVLLLSEGIVSVAAASVSGNVCVRWRRVGPHLPALLAEAPAPGVVVIASLTRRQAFPASVPIYAGLVARALGGTAVELVYAGPYVRELAAKPG